MANGYAKGSGGKQYTFTDENGSFTLSGIQVSFAEEYIANGFNAVQLVLQAIL